MNYAIVLTGLLLSPSARADVFVCQASAAHEAGYAEGLEISGWDDGDVEPGILGKSLILPIDQLRDGKPIRKVLTGKPFRGELKLTVALDVSDARADQLTLDVVHERDGRIVGRYHSEQALVAGIHAEFRIDAPETGLRGFELGCGIPTGR